MSRSFLRCGVCLFFLPAMTGCVGQASGTDSEALHVQAEELLMAENFDGALQVYDRILSVNRNDVWAHIGRGDALTEMDRFEEAIRSFDRAIAVDDRLSDAYTARGWAYEWNEQWDKALDDYHEALRLEPENVDALCGLGWVYSTCPREDLRHGKRAVEFASQALRVTGNDDAIALDTLGTAYAETGDFARAIASAQQALVQVEGNEDIYGTDFAARIEGRIKRYEQGLPHRDEGEDGNQ